MLKKTNKKPQVILLHMSKLNKKSYNKSVQEMEKLVGKVVGLCRSNLGSQ